MIEFDTLMKKCLDLAIKGKLVPQDTNDEPASELLKKIKAEKEQLIKDKKIKKDKNESTIFRGKDGLFYETIGNETKCIQEEIPFEIPNSWEWCRLKFFATVLGGKRIPAGRKLVMDDTGHKYIRVSDMQNESVNTDSILYVPNDIYESISKYIINKEDVYITVAGTIGRVGKIPSELDGANLTENADRLVFSIVDQDWVIKVLSSNVIQHEILFSTTQVGQPKLAIKRIEELLFPLPPLSEQKRIVEKLEEIKKNVELGKNAYTEISKDITPRIKKKILDLAIKGQLVPQDPNDEPASELLKKIKAEKEQLIKDKKIKKDKNESTIFRGKDGLFYETIGNETKCIQEEIPFEIPNSWEWCRLKFIAIDMADGPFGSNLKKEHYTSNKEVRIIQLSNIGEFEWKNSNVKYTTYTHLGNIQRSEVDIGDIVIAKMMPAGRAIIVPNIDLKYVLSSDAVKLKLSDFNICKEFIMYAINSQMFKNQVYEETQGVTRVRTSLSKLRDYFVPIPPLSEQKRIVEKLEEITSQIDLFDK